MKHRIISALLFFFVQSPAFSATWTDFMSITSNYFEGVGTDQQVVVTLESNFNPCGWGNAANININVVGSDAFKTYSSVILSAIMANKKVSLKTDGCTFDRATVVGVRVLQ